MSETPEPAGGELTAFKEKIHSAVCGLSDAAIDLKAKIEELLNDPTIDLMNEIKTRVTAMVEEIAALGAETEPEPAAPSAEA